MAEKKNSFFWYAVWFFVLQLVVLLVLIPGDRTYRVMEKEYAMIEKTLGTDSLDWIQSKATDWHYATLIESGLYQAAQRHLIPTEAQRLNSRGMEKMGMRAIFPWVQGRLDAFSAVLLNIYFRVAHLLIWLPFIAILFVPAIYDGFMTWRIKQSNYQYASPLIHTQASRLAFAILICLFIAFFAPIAMSPLIVPVAIMVFVVLIGVSIGHMQKRI